MTLWQLREIVESHLQVWHGIVLVLLGLLTGMYGVFRAWEKK